MHEKFIMRRQEVLNERYLMRDADFLSLFEKIIELTTILALFLDEKTADEIRTSVLAIRMLNILSLSLKTNNLLSRLFLFMEEKSFANQRH